MNIRNLSTQDRIQLAQELWESVRESSNDIAVTPDQQAVIEQRLAAMATDGNPGDTWENVKRRITKA